MMKTNYILHLQPSAPIDDQLYRLKKIDEMEQFLRSEVAYRDQLSKRYKRRAAAVTISDTSVVTAITLLSIGSVATLASGVGMPVTIALTATGLVLSLTSAIVHKTQKIFNSKAKKHDKIKVLARSQARFHFRNCLKSS